MEGTRDVAADARRTVAGALRAAILQGEFVPRQRLVEADLCERFGASRFIVRAVLQDLSAQGLVEFQRNRGARVREISLAEAIEISRIDAAIAIRARLRRVMSFSLEQCSL